MRMSQSTSHIKHNAAVIQLSSSACYLLVSIALIHLTMTVMCKSDQATHDISRKSIVFDIKTPKVFYCPQEKQADSDKTIVMAKPLEKLCEFKGKSKPKDSRSDCYNDVDETEFACEEKKRFMLRLDTIGEEGSMDNLDDLGYIIEKNKKKLASGKKY